MAAHVAGLSDERFPTMRCARRVASTCAASLPKSLARRPGADWVTAFTSADRNIHISFGMISMTSAPGKRLPGNDTTAFNGVAAASTLGATGLRPSPDRSADACDRFARRCQHRWRGLR